MTVKIMSRYTGQILLKVDKANLYRANLCGANLYGADLRGANLCGADLYGANLCEANLCGANLYVANLYVADLREADLCGADLCVADLYGVNLCEADLCGADLCESNLREANLRGADLCGADLCEANLYGADLREANLTWTILDPDILPSWIDDAEIISAGLEVRGEWIYGWRTETSQHVGNTKYVSGETYTTPVFSGCPETECHPGIYFASKEWLNNNYSNKKLVRVRAMRHQTIHVKNKWRARFIEVL